MIHKFIKGLTFVIALVLLGYVVFLKWPKASVKSKEVVAEMSAGDLYLDFTTNEQEAQTKYLGKALIVNGVIADKYEDETGAPVIILQSDSGDPAVLITLEMKEGAKIIPYSIGDPIKVKAQCSGLLMEVTMNKGLIL